MADGHADTTRRLVVALVRGVHGLRGAVRVEVLTDRPEQRFRAGIVLYREGSDGPLTIASAEPVADGPGWRVRFEEITTRDAADTLRGAYLESVVHPLGDLARGEVYWHEVVGVTVRGLDGTELGRRPRRLPRRRERGLHRDRRARTARSTCRPSGRSSGSSRRAAARSSIDAEALDLQPPKVRPTGEDRPRAPRRKSRRPRTPEAPT